MEDVKVTSKDLPILYQMADMVSRDAQREFTSATVAYIAALILGAAVTFATSLPGAPAILLILAVLLFLAAALISLWLFFQKPDADWYNARSVSESIKTRAWRWMMCAAPYDDETNVDASRRLLIRDLREILSQNRGLSNRVGSEGLGGQAIPQVMERVRSLPLDRRLAIYKCDRIEDQLRWYQSKTQHNRLRGKQWLVACITLNFIASGLLLYKLQAPNVTVPVEVVAVMASSSLTWMQVKKFRELAASYGLAAYEITLIQGEVNQVDTEEELSRFVLNAENAFSREHTQWAARKD